jgi:hypothetical protein
MDLDASASGQHQREARLLLLTCPVNLHAYQSAALVSTIVS